MTSFIVRDVPASYFPPGAVMYLSEGGALPRVGDESEEEEEEDRDRMGKYKEKKESRVTAPHGLSGIRKGVEGSRSTLAKKNSDSAYSSMDRRSGRVDNDDCISTASSVPVDPSTQVPVFLSTLDMEFVVAGDSPDGRKVLTLYNPYDYAFEYKIFCTAPEHYDIKYPAGSLVNAKHLVEITIRAMPSLAPKMVHRIKIDIKRVGRNEILGSRIVTIRAVSSPTYQSSGDHGVFHQMEGDGRRREMERGGDGMRRRMGERAVARDVRIVDERAAQPAYNIPFLVIVCVMCCLALCLPIQKETDTTDSIIPHFLHITHTQRVMAAFIFGVCTVLLLKPDR